MLFQLYFRFPKQLFLSIFYYILATLPHIVIPIVTANIINIVAYPDERALRNILLNAATIVILLLLNIPTNVLRMKYQSVVLRRVEAGLRGALVRKLQQLSISFHKEMQSGRIQSKLMRDVETVHSLAHQFFTTMPQIVINMLTALVIVSAKDLRLFVFFILCIPASVTLTRAFRKPIGNNSRTYRQNMEETSANLMDMVEMTEITRAHALENREIHKMTTLLGNLAKTGYRLDKIHAWFNACSWVIFQVFQLSCLMFSAYLALRPQHIHGI